MSLMRCEGLGCRLSRHWVLRGIDLRVQAGERIALVGANGSGKTTLLRALHGLQALEEGRITWMAPTRQAMVFQRPHMMPARVRQQVSLSLWLAAKPLQRWPLGWAADAWAAWQAASEQTEGVLHQAHLHEQAHLPAQALSMGQRQRLAFALALARKPQVLFLDEPTAHLDPQGKRDMETRIREACEPDANGVSLTLIFSSHNLGQVKRLASRVWYVEHGAILADLPTERFFGEDLSASHPEAHAFLKGERE
ncbi:MAG: ATP-binding cassette domain-containing protein [Betaproteobacteria bacterium]|jgi:tungstate transport system ATP-binding protein|nr:ATP-binding cassette domain-containing protein [Betaproteobacteria bacterium]NBP45323.1 ATP-binding cassette domain-containing protein [Betaproteobacteria bacterium]